MKEKQLNSKTVKKKVSKHFADIFRVEKWVNNLCATFVQGAAIAQCLQGFMRWGLFCEMIELI